MLLTTVYDRTVVLIVMVESHGSLPCYDLRAIHSEWLLVSRLSSTRQTALICSIHLYQIFGSCCQHQYSHWSAPLPEDADVLGGRVDRHLGECQGEAVNYDLVAVQVVAVVDVETDAVCVVNSVLNLHFCYLLCYLTWVSLFS